MTQFVWAKVTGFSYWPAIIVKPTANVPEQPQPGMHWVYFFGSNNYAWIKQKYIKPYQQYRKKYLEKCSKSVLEADKKLRTNRRQLKKNPNFKIDFVEFTVKKKRSRSRSQARSRSTTRKRIRNSSERSSPGRVEISRSNELDPQVVISRPQGIVTQKEPIGVLACNMYAESITKRLIETGHKVLVWSTSESLCETLKQFANARKSYFKIFKYPRDLVEKANIIFSCLSSVEEVKAMLGELGLDDKKDHTLREKYYVEMSAIDFETSYTINNYMQRKRAKYMEAMIEGTFGDVENQCALILVSAKMEKGEKYLSKWQSCFYAISKAICLVGDIGVATKYHAIFQMMRAEFLAGFTECLAIADKCIDLKVFFNMLESLHLGCPYFKRICEVITNETYSSIDETLVSLQEGLEQMLIMSSKLKQSAPLAATANQLYKHARRLGFDDRDSSCMFLRARY